MKLQAILVARRILSGTSSKALVRCLWTNHVESYCNSLLDSEDDRFTEVLEINWILLEGVRVHADGPRDTYLWEKIYWVTSHITHALLELETEQKLNSEMLNLSFELIFHMLNRWPTQRNGLKSVPMSDIYALVSMLIRTPAEMVTEEIKNCVRQFVERDKRDK